MIGPGYFRADLAEVFYQDPTWCATMLEKIPAGRFGALDDLIGATAFLRSDAARDVTGQLLSSAGSGLAIKHPPHRMPDRKT